MAMDLPPEGLWETVKQDMRELDRTVFNYTQDLFSDTRQLFTGERWTPNVPDNTFLDQFLPKESAASPVAPTEPVVAPTAPMEPVVAPTAPTEPVEELDIMTDSVTGASIFSDDDVVELFQTGTDESLAEEAGFEQAEAVTDNFVAKADGTGAVATTTTLQELHKSFFATESPNTHIDNVGIFTMPYGIVPTGGLTMADIEGNVSSVSATDKSITSANMANVDTSNAEFTLDGTTVLRSDYTDDSDFSKAVVSLFADKTADMIDSHKDFKFEFNDLPSEGKEALIDMQYNAGLGVIKDDAVTLANEMAKRPAERDTGNLVKFTRNMKAGGENSLGILARRADSYNKVAPVADKAKYVHQTPRTTEGTSTFSLLRADGTTIKSWTKTSDVAANSAKGNYLTVAERTRLKSID